MAGVSKYTDADRTKVNTALTIHDGNVKRTARETGFPEATVRLWKKKWEAHGVPAEVEARTSEEVAKFVTDTLRVRDLALKKLEESIPFIPVEKAKDVAVIFGILDDKVTRAQGKPTSIKATQDSLSPREISTMFAGYIAGVLGASKERERDIIDANEWEQSVVELPQ